MTKYVKAFMVGFSLSALVLLITLALLEIYSLAYVLTEVDVLLYPIAFGFWNAFYFLIKDRYPIKKATIRYGIHGAFLGLILSVGVLISTVRTHGEMVEFLTSILPNADFYWHGLSPIWVPILFYLWWAFLFKPLNKVVDLKV